MVAKRKKTEGIDAANNFLQMKLFLLCTQGGAIFSGLSGNKMFHQAKP
jgi:hypothetical protein